MGLFDWLRPRPTLAITCWLDEPGRMRGSVRAILADRERGDRVLVVGHFVDALVRTGEQLAAAGIPFETTKTWTDADSQRLVQSPPGTVMAVLARSLPNVDAKNGGEQAAAAPAADAPTVAVHLCDVHVLTAENERVERFARSLPARTRVAASISFDDPIMASFAQPWVKSMMGTLGLREDEPIDSAMVTRGLRRALKKLEARATGNVPCDSLSQWMQQNLRP